MNIAISNTSDKPIYQQMTEQISALIVKGELGSGYPLPPIRQAATELRVSIITVKKAWEELERLGLIYTVTGKGCFVHELSPSDMARKRKELIQKQMTVDAAYYKSFGLSVEEAVELLREIY